MMITEKEYLKAKEIVYKYEKQINKSIIIPCFSNLRNCDKIGIHEVLFLMDIIKLEDDDKVENYYNQLPDNIKEDGMRWGFQDTVVMDNMFEWFKNNL